LASYLLAYEEKNFGGNVRTLQSAKTNTKRVMTQFAGFIENGRPSVGVQAVGNQRNC
jgi:hypothetical protein